MTSRRAVCLALALAAAAAVAGCERRGDVREPTAAPARPRLVVLIVIDQLPSWSFERDAAHLRGGIARLLREGAVWWRAQYPYATTNTGPGHATLGTGVPPSQHGIVANRWFEHGAKIEVADDPDSLRLDVAGGAPRPGGASARRLTAPGLAEALHAAWPQARAVTLAWKSRAAVLVAGQHPDLALWFDAEQAAMTTSTSYRETVPPWLAALARTHGRDALLQPWSIVDPERLEAIAPGGDEQPGEADPEALGARFPHAPRSTKALAFVTAADTLLVDAAIAAIDGESLGRDDAPDLLALSFSPHDYAGHAWCQESWERAEHLLTIDRELVRLLDHLDAQLGHDRYAVVFTSDHGALPSRALAAAAGRPSRLWLTTELEALAQRAAAEVLGEGTWVDGANTTALTLSASLHAHPQRDVAIDRVATRLREAGLAWVQRTDTVPADCGAADDLAALVCRSIAPDHGGDLYLVAPEHDLLNDEDGECTAHGSPWRYDREVPVIIRAPGLRAATQSSVPSMLQLAPTIAALLGVAPPPRADAAPLPGVGAASAP